MKLRALTHCCNYPLMKGKNWPYSIEMSQVMRKPAFCICVKEAADQLSGSCSDD